MESLRRRRDEMLLEIARPVRRESTWTTAFAQLQRAFQMPEFDLESREHSSSATLNTNQLVSNSMAPSVRGLSVGVSSHAAHPLALSRWRRGHMHVSPAARPRLQAGSPDWSVASEARHDRCVVDQRETATASGEPATREQGAP